MASAADVSGSAWLPTWSNAGAFPGDGVLQRRGRGQGDEADGKQASVHRAVGCTEARHRASNRGGP